MKKKEVLNQWEKATDDLTDYFADNYFGSGMSDVYWVADEIGGVLVINDYFFGLLDMVDYLRYNYSKNDMFAYYDYSLKQMEKNNPLINIASWKKIKKARLTK